MGGFPDDELHGVNPDPAYWDCVLILANLSNVGNVCREILRTVDEVRADFDRSNPAAMEESERAIWGLVNELDELVGALTGKANLSSRHIDQVSTMARRTVKALEFWRLVGNSDVSGLSGKEARVVRECEEDVAPLDRDERQTLMRNVTADIEDAEMGLPFALEEMDQGILGLRDKTVSQPPGADESEESPIQNVDAIVEVPPTDANKEAKQRARTEPSKDAFACYRMSIALGWTQTNIAETITKELGRYIHQGQVSRWIKQVKEWIEDGNILPDMPKPAPITQHTMDPADIDMGARRDHLTYRQRHQKADDSDD